MNQNEFNKLSKDLRNLAVNIPLHWGKKQNNRTDDNINMFKINSYEELGEAITGLSKDKKDYLRRRWYLWKCSQCDEYLFYKNDNVIKNPNPYDKAWDVRINDTLDFDIKGSVIPQCFRDDVESVISNPKEMVDWMYDNQSKGRRYDIQNRLFIIHHSFVEPEREFYLRCAWTSKEKIYKQFADNADKINFIGTHGVTAGVIFLIEREKGNLTFKISGLN